MKSSYKTLTIIAVFLTTVSGCSSSQIDRLEWVGKQPPLSPVQPQSQQEPIMWPSAAEERVSYSSAASLFDSQSKAFFKDQRAQKVGDILTVKIAINDQAKLDNKTEGKRQESDKTGAPSVFGLEKKLFGFLPGNANPASLIDTSTNVNNKGEGKIDRKEIINTDVAAVVTSILGNGNMVIYGSQQVNVNYEQRELTVQGVIRPQDISPKNEVQYSQIAEARISYGGKGLISDIQQPRAGSQVLDIISPF
jgi:flagellar L-ring protein FlgH